MTLIRRPRSRWRFARQVLSAGLAALALAVVLAGGTAGRAQAATLLSQGMPATASSVQNSSFPASAAVDGNLGTRWSSAFSDPQWLQVDLGATAAISQVVLYWETAYATAFQIQTSPDGSTWTTIYSTTTGTGGTQTLSAVGAGRYVRMYGTARATQYGYSLWEFPSPGNDPAFQPGGAYANYFTSYAAANGDTSDTTAQIFGCGGTLAANPQLCAGLNRHVAQLPASEQSDPANFYQAAPANYYAQFWHQNAINGLQYGFPYDDYAGQSSDISITSPQYLVVAVGW
ncbi:MAG TPA: discoidin domain-containing protein [Trebonia sp.]|nr:discoidin domain-containing protein [Trebonia sp.]